MSLEDLQLTLKQSREQRDGEKPHNTHMGGASLLSTIAGGQGWRADHLLSLFDYNGDKLAQ